jgi:hypothetical protein
MTTNEIPDSWTLDDIMEKAPRSKTPITSKYFKKGEKQVMSFRISMEDHVKMQRIVQQRRIPGIETYSDIMNDAVFCWLEKFYEEHPTVNPAAAEEMRMIRLEAERDERTEFLVLCKKVLDGLKEDRHVKGMEQYLTSLVESKYDFVNRDAPPDYIEKLDDLIRSVRNLIDASK